MSEASQAAILVERLRKRGVDVVLEEGTLRYRGPRGAVDPELRAELVANRDGIAELLAVEAEYQRLYGRVWDLMDVADVNDRYGRHKKAASERAEAVRLIEGPYSTAGHRLLEIVGDHWAEFPSREEVSDWARLVGVHG